MLKWAVSSRRPGECHQSGRLSLDSSGITKPKVTRRRSLGAPSCRRRNQNHARRVLQDKENLNYMAGCTPCFPSKDRQRLSAIRKSLGKSPLRDISNITPKSASGSAKRARSRSRSRSKPRRTQEQAETPKVLNPPLTPTTCIPKTANISQHLKRRRILLDSSTELTDLEKLDDPVNNVAVKEENRSSPLAESCPTTIEAKSVIHCASLPTFEIEYFPSKTLIGYESNTTNDDSVCLTTLPVIGSRTFIKNPLYFKLEDVPKENDKKLKLNAADNFSALINRLSPMSALRFNGNKQQRARVCSDVSPLAKKLASLCFNRMQSSTLSPEEDAQISKKLYSSAKDEEASAEMETKRIGDKSIFSKEEASLSDSKMGDATLEKMIEDILKSTKKVKQARRVKLKTKKLQLETNEEEPDGVPKSKDANGNNSSECDHNLEKDSKLSTEDVEFCPSPSSEDKTFIIYDNSNFSEREVKTPENYLSVSMDFPQKSSASRGRKRCSSECTPLHNSLPPDCDFNLKRQRCVRRRKAHHKECDDECRMAEKDLSLTLKEGIPSPFTPENKRDYSRLLQSDSFNSITGYPFFGGVPNESNCLPDYATLGIPTFDYGVSNSSMMLGQYSCEKTPSTEKMFGLTLESGIPSPACMFNNVQPDSGFSMSSPILSSSCLEDDPEMRRTDDTIDVLSEPATPVVGFRTSRRCLTYSPEYSDFSDDRKQQWSGKGKRGAGQGHQLSGGEVEFAVYFGDDQIKIHIIRCQNLQKHNGSTKNINAYVKVRVNELGTYQRTPVHQDSNEPYFGHWMCFPHSEFSGRKLQVSVWHRDRQKRRSEFLGCISLPLSHAVRKEISGCWSLVSGARPYREAGAAPPRGRRGSPVRRVLNDAAMATDCLPKDGDECSRDVGETGGKLATQQKEADEHLFLRYLELDPIEGPDAGAAAVQRKASGNRAGRTPFTSTRRLVRTTDQGFGFSVVWTRPPRVERVEAGKAAERAGLLPGDYIVFVDRHNVVTLPESQVLTLIKSSGTQLMLETFRRPNVGVGGGSSTHMGIVARGSIASHVTISEAPCSPRTAPASRGTAEPPQARRRPGALLQLAFNRESITGAGSGIVTNSGGGGSEHIKALHAVVIREQQYTAWMQFGIERFIVPLASKPDVISPSEHKLLFQNCEELLRLSEDILEQLVTEEGEVQLHLIASVYLARLPTLISLYKTYCNGLKRADCVLVQKSRQQGSSFVKWCTEPPIPRRRPDVTQFVHKPLEQFRELLRLLRTARSVIPSSHPDYSALVKLVNELQNAYHDITAGAGLMGPIGEGRPLLSVSDLESRLVFTRCKPFTLAKPGRQWIFGGDLARVEGRTVRPYWALLFSDLLLFATVSRDRVLFITEEPLPIVNIAETCFNIRKKANEFRLAVGPGRANSPTARCGPPVRARARTIILRAPSPDLKAVWQSLLLRQICRINSSSGTPLSSPMESPAPLGCYSEATLDSQQRQTTTPLPEIITEEETRSSRISCKGAALHLARWMKSHPGGGSIPPEPEPEVWSTEQLRKRSKELRLLENEQLGNTIKISTSTQITLEKSPSENERSPSRSTNSDSQITVRSSPVVPETVAVCRQCHKRCFSKPNSPLIASSVKSVLQNEKKIADVKNENFELNDTSCQNKIEQNKTNENYLNNNISVENKPNVSPQKKSAIETMSEIRTAIIKSRESFFKSSESCSSPLNRASPRSPCSQKSDSSRSTLYSTNSPISYAHTTCSSIGLSNSTGKKSLSPGRDSLASEGSGHEETVQCVIAQEKYLNEVKCVENIILSKGSPFRHRLKEQNKIYMGKTIVERNSSASKSVNKPVVSECFHNSDKTNTYNCLTNSDLFPNVVKNPANGDLRKVQNSSINETKKPSTDFSWGPLMLMGLSAINPAAHFMQADSQNRQPTPRTVPRTIASTIVPNISVVPPTPDFKSESKNLLLHTQEDSPDDSPIAEEPPYLALKRYGTMSSLERLPSDELDESQINNISPPQEKEADTSQGLLGWTARAGNYVVEKMALLNSLAESSAASTGASFFERYLGAGEWRTVRGVVGIENEGGEGSGASGEEAWGTPSSGDLSDHAFPDSDHATLSSPTKSSSSCPGDEDTELMMDELLMTPPITGPSLRPLLPRRRLEPLMEEEGSDASSTSSAEAASEITPSPTDQGSGVAGGVADPRPPEACRFIGRLGPPPSPDRTPTNPLPPTGVLGPVLLTLLRGSPERGLDGRSTSSSTLEGCRSAPDGSEESECESVVAGKDSVGSNGEKCVGATTGGRLSPRMEMRLALQEGTDILAEQEQRWDQVSAHCGWVRRPLGYQQSQLHNLAGLQNTILSNSVSAQTGLVKVSAMERLAFLEARGARRGTRRPRPTNRLMGLVRRRALSDSPERRPYSPRRQQPHERQMDRRFWKQLRRRSSGNLANIPS